MMTFPNYTRTLTSGRYDVDVKKLAKEIKAAVGKGCAMSSEGSDIVVDDAADPFTAGEKTTCDTAVTDHIAADDPLKEAKVAKINAIRVRTDELTAGGFEYPAASGKIFDLSPASLVNILGVDHSRDIAGFGYPVEFNTADELDEISLANSTEVRSFYLAALVAYRGHRDSGTALKTSVRAATTVAEVDAVVDLR